MRSFGKPPEGLRRIIGINLREVSYVCFSVINFLLFSQQLWTIEMDNTKKDELLLIQLILMFQTAALQHMGKLKNPISDKIEQDLPQAQISIDILDMLHNKMKTNLTPEEERMFTTVLQELKLNYVDEVGKAQKSSSGPPSSDQPQTSAPTS